MFILSKRKKRFIAGLVTAGAVGLAFCLVSHFDLLHQTRLQSNDFFFKAADVGTASDPDSPIVIVGIDDGTMEQMGSLSTWSRSYHADLIDNLVAAGARVIVFDVLFAEPATGDAELVAAIERAGNVILASAAGDGAIISPLEQLQENALTVGNAGVIPDGDGIVRRLPLVVPNGDDSEPALSLAAVAGYLRRPQSIETSGPGYLHLAGRSIPLNQANNMLINFASNSFSTSDFKFVPYADVLANDFPAGAFKDKIALVGATAVGLGDTFWTPMGRLVPGVELHANSISTILTANFLAPAPSLLTFISILVFSLLAGLAVLRLGTLRAVAVACFLVVIYCLVAFFTFDRGMVLDILYPLVALAGAFVGVSLYSVTLERLEKREIANTFGRYVSPAVASKVLEAVDDDTLAPGGEECEATVLFADARNFTRLSETCSPR